MSLYDRALEQMERPLFTRVLRQCNGNQCEAAKKLGLSRGTLSERLNRYGIDAWKFRPAADERA